MNGKVVGKSVVENIVLQLDDEGFNGAGQLANANAEYDDGGEEPNKNQISCLPKYIGVLHFKSYFYSRNEK